METKKFVAGKVTRKEEVMARKEEVMVGMKAMKILAMERKLLVMGVRIAKVWLRKILRRAKEQCRMLQRKEGAGYQTVPGKALSQRGLTMGLQVAR